jgi:hypothetical protein
MKSVSKERSKMQQITTVNDIRKNFPQIVEQVEREELAKFKKAEDAAIRDEQDRLINLAAYLFGQEHGANFKTIVKSKITAEQYLKIKYPGRCR